MAQVQFATQVPALRVMGPQLLMWAERIFVETLKHLLIEQQLQLDGLFK
ncbi:hypothetical protein ACJJU9_18895 [Pseudomonas helleri]